MRIETITGTWAAKHARVHGYTELRKDMRADQVLYNTQTAFQYTATWCRDNSGAIIVNATEPCTAPCTVESSRFKIRYNQAIMTLYRRIAPMLIVLLLLATVATNANAAHRITSIADCSGSTCIDQAGHVVKVSPLNREDKIFAGKVTLVKGNTYDLRSGARHIRIKIKESN